MGPVLRFMKMTPFSRCEPTVGFGLSVALADSPLLPVQTNKFSVRDLSISYTVGDPMALFHLSVADPIPCPGMSSRDKD
jgi:hypothetical protein